MGIFPELLDNLLSKILQNRYKSYKKVVEKTYEV